MKPESAIEASGLIDQRGRRRVLDGIDLRVASGGWTALLGANGAGKSSLLRVLAGLRRPAAGRLSLFGRPADSLGRRERAALIGYVPQSIACYRTLTVAENLAAFGALSGLRGRHLRQRIDWALEWSGLGASAARPVQALSGGTARRLNLAVAILHRPALILLDEPTEGIDTDGRARMWRMLADLRAEGATIIHCSHHFEDVESHCDAAIILRAGRVAAAGSLGDLLQAHAAQGSELRLRIETPLPEDLPEPLQVDSEGILARLACPARDLTPLLDRLASLGHFPQELHLRRPGLREAFKVIAGGER